MKRLQPTAMLALGMYKFFVSPFLPAACRFTPTCSDYAREAIETYGVWRGSAMTAARILRCNPFGKSGFDPVPVPHACSESGSFHE